MIDGWEVNFVVTGFLFFERVRCTGGGTAGEILKCLIFYACSERFARLSSKTGVVE